MREGVMGWQYSQSLRQLRHNGKVVGLGYSGHGEGKNNPKRESERGVGPIPRGKWHIGPVSAHHGKGPVVMELTPVHHTAHGRTHFLIHGDSKEHPGTASEGCIILGPTLRALIRDSKDHDLEVVL
jgi:hypothetical protein